MDEVQEIKDKLDIVQLVNDYTPLVKSGVNWKACCPFHGEKTPSFMVNQDRQFYYCFGCNEGGDIFNFIQKIEGIDFPEALKILAKKAGVTLTKSKQRATSQKTRLLDAVNLASRYWQGVLKSKYGFEAQEYLKSRQLDLQTIDAFQIGYAPDSWDATMKVLLARGFNESELFMAGLVVKKDRGSGYYDRFRDRIIFPITDIHGNIVGFSARAMKDEMGAKYINTPETPIYHKSSILFGMDKAKKAIRDNDLAVVVEGNMDVIASHKIGVHNVVAVSGTALTREQIGLIKRFSNNIALCFDMDEAGQRAVRRSIDIALGDEMNIKIVQLLSGKDPDECIKNNIEDWQKSIDGSTQAMQYYFDQVFERFNIADIEQKKQVAKILLLEISKIVNPIEKDHWLKILAQRIGVSDQLLQEVLPKKNQNIAHKQEKKYLTTVVCQPEKPKKIKIQELLISLILNYPEHIIYVSQNLSPEMLISELAYIYKKIIVWYNKNNKLSKSELSDKFQQIDEIEQSYINSLYLLVDKEFSSYAKEDIPKTLIFLVRQIKENYFQSEIQKIQNKLQQKSIVENNEAVNELLQELQEIISKKQQIQ